MHTHTFICRVAKTTGQIIFIQQKFRNLCDTMNKRKVALRFSILPQHTFHFGNLLLSSKQSHYKTLHQLTEELQNEHKDFISDCFIALAKLDFRMQFLKWFLMNRVDRVQEQAKAEEIVISIEELQKEIYAITDFIAGEDPQTIILLREIGYKNQEAESPLVRRAPSKSQREMMPIELQHCIDRRKSSPKKAPEKGRRPSLKTTVESMLVYKVKAYQQAIELIQTQNISSQMPQFAIFSRMNKDLLKFLLLRMTEVKVEQLPGIRQQLLEKATTETNYLQLMRMYD